MQIQNIKQALVLAGGEGTRLKPITQKIPKPMIEIHGKPFLEYQLELLAKNKITDAVLCVAYLWEQIKDHFGDTFEADDGSKLNIHYSVEPRLLGTGGAIKNAEKFITDHFFVVNGDTYLSIDYQDLGESMIRNNTLGSIAVYENHDKIVQNNIQTDNVGLIVKYDKEHESEYMTGVDAGVAVYRKDLLNLLPENIPADQKVSLENEINPKLIIQHQLFGYLTKTRFYDMGTFERLEIISEVLK
jgi:NDP-sugar pyrophosphorylase family protein